MINKTNSIKLYTEEQVKKLIDGYYDVNWIIQDAFDELEPIELPSDEEIEEEFKFDNESYYIFSEGAKYMKELIIKQANEK